MTAKELGLTFIERFCHADINGLIPLLADELQFRGPLLQCDSREEYLSRLAADPPVSCEYEVRTVIEQEDEACILYDYHNPNYLLSIAQFFTVNDHQIFRLELVFDTGSLSANTQEPNERH